MGVCDAPSASTRAMAEESAFDPANILVKALMALPAADFRLCAGLLPARVMRQEPFATLSAMLEQADFGAFWKKVSEVKELTDKVKGFEEAVRRFGLHCVAATFGNCDVSMVAGVLNVQEGEVA